MSSLLSQRTFQVPSWHSLIFDRDLRSSENLRLLMPTHSSKFFDHSFTVQLFDVVQWVKNLQQKNLKCFRRKSTARATLGQIDTLLALLEAFLYPRKFTGLQDRENYDRGWKVVAEQLNAFANAAIKTPEKWITVNFQSKTVFFINCVFKFRVSYLYLLE